MLKKKNHQQQKVPCNLKPEWKRVLEILSHCFNSRSIELTFILEFRVYLCGRMNSPASLVDTSLSAVGLAHLQ